MPPSTPPPTLTTDPPPKGPAGPKRRSFMQMRELHEWAARAILRGERVADICARAKLSHGRLIPVVDGSSRYLRPKMARLLRDLARRQRDGALLPAAAAAVAPTAQSGPEALREAHKAPSYGDELVRLRQTVLSQALEIAALKQGAQSG